MWSRPNLNYIPGPDSPDPISVRPLLGRDVIHKLHGRILCSRDRHGEDMLVAMCVLKVRLGVGDRVGVGPALTVTLSLRIAFRSLVDVRHRYD